MLTLLKDGCALLCRGVRGLFVSFYTVVRRGDSFEWAFYFAPSPDQAAQAANAIYSVQYPIVSGLSGRLDVMPGGQVSNTFSLSTMHLRMQVTDVNRFASSVFDDLKAEFGECLC